MLSPSVNAELKRSAATGKLLQREFLRRCDSRHGKCACCKKLRTCSSAVTAAQAERSSPPRSRKIEPRPGIRHVSPHPDQGLITALPNGGRCGDHLALCSASTPPSLGQFVSLPLDSPRPSKTVAQLVQRFHETEQIEPTDLILRRRAEQSRTQRRPPPGGTCAGGVSNAPLAHAVPNDAGVPTRGLGGGKVGTPDWPCPVRGDHGIRDLCRVLQHAMPVSLIGYLHQIIP